jgi:hypothetical protein
MCSFLYDKMYKMLIKLASCCLVDVYAIWAFQIVYTAISVQNSKLMLVYNTFTFINRQRII